MASKPSDGAVNDGFSIPKPSDPMETPTGDSPSFRRKRKGENPEDSDEEIKDSDEEIGDGAEEIEGGVVYEDFEEEEEEDLDDSDSYWDRDSFDGREFHSSDESKCSDEELREQINLYTRTVIESKGFFKVDESFPAFYVSGIVPGSDPERKIKGMTMTIREFYGNMAAECVEKYNKRNNKNVKFDHFMRGNFNPGGTARGKYYITFGATESDAGPIVEYQAKAIRFRGKTYPVFCRPTPMAPSLL